LPSLGAASPFLAIYPSFPRAPRALYRANLLRQRATARQRQLQQDSQDTTTVDDSNGATTAAAAAAAVVADIAAARQWVTALATEASGLGPGGSTSAGSDFSCHGAHDAAVRGISQALERLEAVVPATDEGAGASAAPDA
jgi:hypothetical protein